MEAIEGLRLKAVVGGSDDRRLGEEDEGLWAEEEAGDKVGGDSGIVAGWVEVEVGGEVEVEGRRLRCGIGAVGGMRRVVDAGDAVVKGVAAGC